MKAKPIYIFDTMDSTGLDKVPVEAIVLVKDDGSGQVHQFIKETNTGITSTTTILDALNSGGKLTLVSYSLNKLSELDDVDSLSNTTSPQILMWDNTTGKWKPSDLPATQVVEGYLAKAGNGYVILDTDMTNKGTIGNHSVDLSRSTYGSNKGAIGNDSFAAGVDSTAEGDNTVAIGNGARADNDGIIVLGSYNDTTDTHDKVVIGIGDDDTTRKTGLSVKDNGLIIADNSAAADIASNEKALTTKEYVDQVTAASGTLLSLDNIGDVDAAAPIDSQVLRYNSTTSHWEQSDETPNVFVENGVGYSVDGIDNSTLGTLGQDAINMSTASVFGAVGATGDNSFTANSQTSATGSASAAFGDLTEANGNISFAAGSDNRANGDYSSVFGKENTADGDRSFAIGSSNTANAADSFVSGTGNIASSINGTVVGKYADDDSDAIFNVGTGIDTVQRKSAFKVKETGEVLAPEMTLTSSSDVKSLTTKEYVDSRTSSAAGHLISKDNGFIVDGLDVTRKGTTGTNSIDMSDATTGTTRGPTGNNSVTTGTNTTASGNNAVATGSNSEARGNDSNAHGTQSLANGLSSFAAGDNTEAYGASSFAGNHHTIAEGNYSTALGSNTKAEGEASIALGVGSIAKNKGSVAVGLYNVGTSEHTIFEIGNGADSSNRSNALEVHDDGNVLLISLDKSLITDNKAVITKEYLEDAITQLNLSVALDDLSDADMSNKENYDIVMWDEVNQKWIPSSITDFSARGLLKLHSLTDIEDVSLANINNNDALVWDASTLKWTNKNIDLLIDNNFANRDGGYAIPEFVWDNKAPTGEHAVDLSYSESGSNLGASGKYSFTSGNETAALKEGAHAEGLHTKAEEYASHAEGDHAIASGVGSHAEGNYTKAEGMFSHAEGDHTVASGKSAVAINSNTIASGENSFAGGKESVASGNTALVFGAYSEASGDESIALGSYSKASGYESTALGSGTASNTNSIAIGSGSQASGEDSISIGSSSEASNRNNVSIGSYSNAIGEGSTAIGGGRSTGEFSLSIGIDSLATGQNSISLNGAASGPNSFACGFEAEASGEHSIAIGKFAESVGDYSVAIGNNVRTIDNAQSTCVVGRYNSPGTNNVFEVGIGTSSINQNGLEVRDDGKVVAPSLDVSSIDEDKVLTTREYVDELMQDHKDTVVINDMNDVDAGSPNDKDILVWNSTTSKWEPKQNKIQQFDFDATDGQTDFVISGHEYYSCFVTTEGVMDRQNTYTISQSNGDTIISFNSGKSENDWVCVTVI